MILPQCHLTLCVKHNTNKALVENMFVFRIKFNVSNPIYFDCVWIRCFWYESSRSLDSSGYRLFNIWVLVNQRDFGMGLCGYRLSSAVLCIRLIRLKISNKSVLRLFLDNLINLDQFATKASEAASPLPAKHKIYLRYECNLIG